MSTVYWCRRTSQVTTTRHFGIMMSARFMAITPIFVKTLKLSVIHLSLHDKWSNKLFWPLQSFACLPLSRMVSHLWPLPSNRATTRWSLYYWKTIPKARYDSLPCTLLPARTIPSQPPYSSKMTTTLMSSRRYTRNTLWADMVCMRGSPVLLCFCGNVSILWVLCKLWILKLKPVQLSFNWK